MFGGMVCRRSWNSFPGNALTRRYARTSNLPLRRLEEVEAAKRIVDGELQHDRRGREQGLRVALGKSASGSRFVLRSSVTGGAFLQQRLSEFGFVTRHATSDLRSRSFDLMLPKYAALDGRRMLPRLDMVPL
jgi:hypothetical protein